MGADSWMISGATALATRPDLWRTAVRVGRTHLPNGWWRSRPFLPIPDRTWMGFRYETAFADEGGRPSAEELIGYLEWSKSWRYLG